MSLIISNIGAAFIIPFIIPFIVIAFIIPFIAIAFIVIAFIAVLAFALRPLMGDRAEHSSCCTCDTKPGLKSCHSACDENVKRCDGHGERCRKCSASPMPACRQLLCPGPMLCASDSAGTTVAWFGLQRAKCFRHNAFTVSVSALVRARSAWRTNSTSPGIVRLQLLVSVVDGLNALTSLRKRRFASGAPGNMSAASAS